MVESQNSNDCSRGPLLFITVLHHFMIVLVILRHNGRWRLKVTTVRKPATAVMWRHLSPNHTLHQGFVSPAVFIFLPKLTSALSLPSSFAKAVGLLPVLPCLSPQTSLGQFHLREDIPLTSHTDRHCAQNLFIAAKGLLSLVIWSSGSCLLRTI